MHETMKLQSNQWSPREHLDDLLQRVTACLPGVPGFQTLSLFGSLAEGRSDGYSDIDVIVTTDDLPAAREHVLGVLAKLGPIESCWSLSLRPDEWNPMIIFADEGYYHKLDLGLAATDATNRTIPPEQTTLLVTRAGDLPLVSVGASQAYTPLEGSVGHFLLGQYIGGIRYCKSRKRGQPLSCYRFLSAATDWCLRALYVHLSHGELSWQAKLSTGEYVTLDRLDVDDQGRAILATLDYSTPATMDQSACRIFRHLHDLCREIAIASNEALPDEVFQRMLAFMHQELEIAILNDNSQLH